MDSIALQEQEIRVVPLLSSAPLLPREKWQPSVFQSTLAKGNELWERRKSNIPRAECEKKTRNEKEASKDST
jgi:hypothetical protein